MGRYLGKRKGVVGEIAVVGVKTRARAALAMAAAATSTSSPPVKKIKKVSRSKNFYQLRNRRKILSVPENFDEKETTSSSSEVVAVLVEEDVANCSKSEVITTNKSDFPPPCSSSNNDQSNSNEVVKDRLRISIADPEVESGEASSRYFDCHRTEASEASKSDNQDSPSTKLPDAAKSTVQINMPSDSEIEEFFSTAEKDLHKRFSDKYNFDIVNDVPLNGRYEWVPLQP